ncbi:acyl carrier protein [Fructobacillus evanidus]|uniref:Acyl carrier protein n=1 Tax=Fructobacillus evanidus TaxID=3064281 RepID=A0ABN9YMK9_9LACO|nr:Acyl carrier protein (AcpP) [Fructobacillus sp. LMG 32999]CAK1231679.1 Acyl carrier protein (AcpP) [Fructobacillus sp. LMG 32999]CAK1232958.1 Acyl carrier protein (AcpP) [Fructobacillus sp. LMG 32999]CAK1236961.1 Acyl carrier protein (AcpP) [Fructobacillus sp. LMG 32999]CAK1237564.1 Acyl carrier protein (AcpP) [Fructobacillus sp. LMG 32999]
MAFTKEQIYDRLAKEAAQRFSLKAEKVSPDLNFAQDTSADSIDVVELVLEVEDEYNMEIPDEELDSLTTLQKVVDYVYVHQA